MGKVLFADQEVTVHTTTSPVQKDQFGNDFWDVRSVTLLPGESVPEGDVPTYVLEAVKAGKVAGLSLKDKSAADELKAKAEEIRAIVAGTPGLQLPAYFGYTAGEDNSHSDYLVSDEERQANLAGVAKSESGEGEAVKELPVQPKLAPEPGQDLVDRDEPVEADAPADEPVVEAPAAKAAAKK